MMLPLALLLSVVVLSTTGSTIQDEKDVGIKDVIPNVGQYTFNPVLMNWTEAYQNCNKFTGHLAVIDSEAEQAALAAMMTAHGATSIHLGFEDRHVEGYYFTVTGQRVVPSQWAVGYPRGPGYNCGGLTADGFIDTDCAVDQAFICEYSTNKAKMRGYELISGYGYYKFYSWYTSWVSAWLSCYSEGAYLHILTSQDEQDQLYAKYNYTDVWVGVHRNNANNNEEFHTIFGKPLANTGYTRWYSDDYPLGTFITHPYVYSHKNERLATQGNYTFQFICEMDDV